MRKRFFAIHRKLSIWLALPVLLWALSGILHPMMANWLQPSIANTFLIPSALPDTSEGKAPSEIYQDLPELHQIKLIQLAGEPIYLAITPNQKWHFRHALTGQSLQNGDKLYAEQLARAYSADTQSTLKEIEVLTDFDSTYGVINRLLPAYRVKLDRADGLEVIVDPRTGRMTSFDTPGKRLTSRLFSWCHTWSFLGKADSPLRITVVLIASSLTLLVALSGFMSLFIVKKRTFTAGQRSRKSHRLLGAVASLFFLMFSLSGIAHIANKYDYDDSTQMVSSQAIATSQLATLPTGRFSKLSLAVIDDQSYYRTVDKLGVTLTHTVSGKVLDDGEELYARHLATEFSGYPLESIEKTELITSFRPDYGFIFKRLPVQRVHYKDQPIWQDTVDTEDAHMAMRTTPVRLAEALSFIYLHKFHFLDFAGRDTRDVVSASAAGLVALTALSGIFLFVRRRKKNRSSHEIKFK